MKTNYDSMVFLQGDADGGGETSLGGAAFTPPAKQTTGDKPLPHEKVDAAISEHDPQVPARSEPEQFDPSKFAKEFGQTVAESLKTAKSAEEPPMTKEEAAKLLNMWEPDDTWYRDYDNLETRKDAVVRMRDGLMRQADTIAQLRMQEALQGLRDEYAPKMTMIEEHANMQREARFHGTFPQLSKPGLQPLIEAVTDNLVKQGKTFTEEGEMFKAIAKGVEAVIKETNPEFKLETAGSIPANQGRERNQIPVTTPGAGGGAGMTTSAKGPVKKGLAVFES
jgi:hypothetical protein